MTDEQPMGVFETATGKRVPDPAKSETEALIDEQERDLAAVGEVFREAAGGGEFAHRAANRRLAETMGVPLAEETPDSERTPGAPGVSLDYGAGSWEDVGPGHPLVFMVAGTQGPVGTRLRVPQAEPQRIDAMRARAAAANLPFTPDMTLEEAKDGVAAIDGMGCRGVFRSETVDGRTRTLFVRDGVTPREAERVDRFVRESVQRIASQRMPESGFGNERDNPIYYYAPTTWPRNGREAGAWIAAHATHQRFCRVRVLTDHVAGAVTSLVDAGMIVGRHEAPRMDLEVPGDAETRSFTDLDVECPARFAGSF